MPTGVGPPNVLPFTVSSVALDLTTVTAVSLAVRRADGSTVTWAASITSASRNLLACAYAFASGDCTSTGPYALAPSLTVPGGSVPAYAMTLLVAMPAECAPSPDYESTTLTTEVIE